MNRNHNYNSVLLLEELVSKSKHTYFVLETMSSSLHVHLFCVGVGELALTQLAVKPDHYAAFISCFLNVFLACNHMTTFNNHGINKNFSMHQLWHRSYRTV